MDTQLSQKQAEATGGQVIKNVWYVFMQIVVLALMALALYWFSLPGFNKANADDFQSWREIFLMYRIPLLVFGIASLAMAVVPSWRRSQLAAFLGGVTLATACWLSSVHTWNLTFFTEADAVIPLMAPIMAGAGILLAVLGLVTRAGIIRGAPAFGNGALAATALLFAASVVCYTVINFTPYFHQPPLAYDISIAQISEMLASIFLFLPALWLGGVGIRRETRWAIQPLGMVIVLAFFLALWQSR